MGQYNSSVTRVWPVFDTLFASDPTGEEWLLPLLKLGNLFGNSALKDFKRTDHLLPELCRFDLPVTGELAKVLGPDRVDRLPMLRHAYERDVPPSSPFLRWLIQNPSRLTWPLVKNGKEKTYGQSAQKNRKKLVGSDLKTQENALNELWRLGACGSRRKWWAFEGFTSVDCLLETDHLLVFIEGKRTEGVSKATDWFPSRNQVLRNLEVAREMAGATKEYAVLLCAEQHVELPANAWHDSLPHYSDAEIKELADHYLGCVTWADVVKNFCPDMQLPDTLDDAVNYCAALRRNGRT